MSLKLKASQLASVAGAAISLAGLMPAFAQTAETSAGPSAEDTIVVVGQRAMMDTSTSRQRDADTVQSVVTRDAIGQFPDQNVAEATRRLPGVNILNDQGEGRFISVRGLDPTLNAASVNGVRLPSPEADTRAVALDVIASELIESIEVKKTLTPDMDADTIGASIEINTTKAFDRKDLFISGTLEGSYNDLNGKTSPKGSIDFSVPISDNFGISGGFSYYDRKTSTDNQEMADWATSTRAGSVGVVYAGTVEYRDYDVERERMGGSLSFDWRAAPGTELYARVLYSQFDDTEKRQRLSFGFESDPVSGTDNTATFVSGPANAGLGIDRQRVTVRRDLKDRFESQKIQSYQVGGETEADAWNFKYNVAYSEAEEHEFDTQDPTRFQWRTAVQDALGVTFDYSNLETTTFNINLGSAAFNNPANYTFAELANIDGMSKDDEWAGKFDASRKFEMGDADLEIKGGLKVRLREKTYSANTQVYDAYTGVGGYSLANVIGSGTYGLADLGVLPDLGLVRAFNSANAGSFSLNADDTFLESNSGTYDVQEDIYAGYVQAKYKTDRLTVVGGVRVEHTQDDLGGNSINEDTLTATPVTFSNDYTDVLPSLNVKYEVMDDVVLRAGLFASVVRPGIGQMAPRFSINADNEGTFGNPELDPYRAWNLDLSAEYYPAPGAVLQVGAFYKDVKDFIIDRTFSSTDAPYNGVYNGIAFDEATIAINGDSAKISGVEFNYQQALDFLPGPFDGLLVGFNYTYTDAKGDVADGAGTREIPLVASAKNTYNAMLGYENGPLSLRVTAAYRDEYLDELGGDAETDRYVKDHLQIDASAKYRVTDNVQIYAEWVNLNDEPYIAFQKGPGRDRLLQFETYSWTAKAGVRLTY